MVGVRGKWRMACPAIDKEARFRGDVAIAEQTTTLRLDDPGNALQILRSAWPRSMTL
jgi:hypothetical protein